MDHKELYDLRQMIYGAQIRVTQMALLLHKEQERIQDLVNIVDQHIAKGA